MDVAQHDQTGCSLSVELQAAQVRKSGYVPDEGVEYHPDNYHTCTVFAGTIVRQVSAALNARYGQCKSKKMACVPCLPVLQFGRALSCQTIQPKVFHPHAGHEQVLP